MFFYDIDDEGDEAAVMSTGTQEICPVCMISFNSRFGVVCDDCGMVAHDDGCNDEWGICLNCERWD